MHFKHFFLLIGFSFFNCSYGADLEEKTPEKSAHFSMLPRDLVVHITEFLDDKSFARFGSTCRYLHELMKEVLQETRVIEIWIDKAADIESLKNCKNLCLSIMHQNHEDLAHLWGFKLKNLTLINEIDLDAVVHLAQNLPWLNRLILRFPLRIDNIDKFKELNGLQFLGLSFIDIPFHQLVRLPELTNLGGLDLHGQITDDGLIHLNRLTRLESLMLDQCGQITDIGLSNLTELTNLKKLSVSEWGNTADTDLTFLERFHNLEMLWLTKSDGQIIGNKLADLVGLKSLYLRFKNITDVLLADISKLTRLENLVLRSCEQITDVGLRYLARLARLENLQFQYSSECNPFSGDGFIHLNRLNRLKSVLLQDMSTNPPTHKYIERDSITQRFLL